MSHAPKLQTSGGMSPHPAQGAQSADDPQDMLSAYMKTVTCGPGWTMQGQENSPAQPGGGTDDGRVTLFNKDKEDLLLLTFPLIIKL